MRTTRIALAAAVLGLLCPGRVRAQEPGPGDISKCSVSTQKAIEKLYEESERKSVEGKVVKEKVQAGSSTRWTIFTYQEGVSSFHIALCLMDTLLLRVSSPTINHIESAEDYLRIELGHGAVGYAHSHMLPIDYLKSLLGTETQEVPQMRALPGIHYYGSPVNISIISLPSPSPTPIDDWLDLGRAEIQAVSKLDIWYGDRLSPWRIELLAIIGRATENASKWSLVITMPWSLDNLKKAASGTSSKEILVGELVVDVEKPRPLLLSSEGTLTLYPLDKPQRPKPTDRLHLPKPVPSEKKPGPTTRSP